MTQFTSSRHSEQLRELNAMGLSTYAARAYLSLLQLGRGEARQVSELAQIPSSKVYGTLEQLERRGLATVVAGKPREYRPVPIGEFLAQRIEEEREAVTTMSSRLDRLVDLFPIIGEAPDAERASVTALRGRRNISENFRRQMQAARREVCIQLPDRWTRRVRAVGSLVRDARAGGVRVLVLRPFSGAPDAHAEADDATGDELDACAEPGVSADVMLATFDGHTALLAHFVPGQRGRDHPKDIAILTHERAFATVFVAFFAQRWSAAARRASSGRPYAHPP